VAGLGAFVIAGTGGGTGRCPLNLVTVAVGRCVAPTVQGHGFGGTARVVIDGLVGALEGLAPFVLTGPLAVSGVAATGSLVIAVGAVQRLSTAVSTVTTETVLAVAGDTVGVFVTDLTVGQVGKTDIVTMGVGVTLLIQGTGVGASCHGLVLGAIANQVLVVAAGVGQQRRAAQGVVANGSAHTHEFDADGANLAALARGGAVAARGFKVGGGAGIAFAVTAIPGTTAAVAVGAVARHAVTGLIALAAVVHVGQADGIAMSFRVTQGIVIETVGETVRTARRGFLVSAPSTVDRQEVATVIGKQVFVASSIVVDGDTTTDTVDAHGVHSVALAGIGTITRGLFRQFHRAIFVGYAAGVLFANAAAAETAHAIIGDTVGVLDTGVAIGEVPDAGSHFVHRSGGTVTAIVALCVIILGTFGGAGSRALLCSIGAVGRLVAATSVGDLAVAAGVIVHGR
jgi:hypothetical protein